MYMSAEGAQVQSRRLEVIANNLANVNTVGFKPDVTGFQARLAEEMLQGGAMPGDRSPSDIGGGVDVLDTTTNFSAGRLQETGNQLDLAIIGNGFFQVRTPTGEQMLTRAGNFSLDSQNRVVNQSGLPVLDSGGSEITLAPGLPWDVSQAGEIRQQGTNFPLALVEPSSLGELNKVGNNLFAARESVSPVPPAQREVRQGFLELSGTNSTRQMMTMIETTRAFEANMRIIQNHDGMTGTLIGRVLQA